MLRAQNLGEADRIVGRAIAGLPRDSYNLVATIGHDFYNGVRRGSSGRLPLSASVKSLKRLQALRG